MNLLIDTHVMLWILKDDRALSQTARAAYADRANQLQFSVASYWELCIKLSLGKLRLKETWRASFERELATNGIRWLPLHPRHIEAVIDLPWHHRDPFDRLLVAQALCEDAAIMTADRQISLYEMEVVW